MFESEKESLIGERNKLISLCEHKSEEIKRLYNTIKKMKESSDEERKQMKAIIDELRTRLKESERASQEQNELLKIKMAQLHKADVENLEHFYENEIASRQKQLQTLEENSAADREKIFSLYEKND